MLKKLKQKLKREHLTNDEYRERKAKRKLHIIYFLIICNITIIANSYVMYSKWSDHYKELLMMSTSGMVRVVGAEASDVATVSTISDDTKELSMEEWVLKEADKRGLNREKVWAIVQCESGWNENAMNNGNNNGSWDGGLFQLNSIHKIDPACVFDFKCNTNEAFNIRIHQGHWGAWVCADILGIK